MRYQITIYLENALPVVRKGVSRGVGKGKKELRSRYAISITTGEWK